MSEKKSVGESKSTDAQRLVDDVSKNSVEKIDEISKVHASEVQQLSELQKEAAELAKSVVITKDESQKQGDTVKDSDIPVSDHPFGQNLRSSNEIVDSYANVMRLYNKLAAQTVDAMQENSRLYGRTMDIVTRYNINLVNAWLSFWNP